MHTEILFKQSQVSGMSREELLDLVNRLAPVAIERLTLAEAQECGLETLERRHQVRFMTGEKRVDWNALPKGM